MWARLSRYAGLPPERLEQTISEFEAEQLPAIEQQPGFEGVMVAVDRKAGKATAITYWDSQENLRASDKLAAQARAAAEATAGVANQPSREPIVDHYEVVIRKP
jgi:heme-degrading monooxygenase HmoA